MLGKRKDQEEIQSSWQWTRRRYLTARMILGGSSWIMAREAVASTAIEHPDWDMEQVKTWKEWEDEYYPNRGSRK